MTAVGKILVFFNLIFAVVTAAMIVVVFQTRTNWKNEYEKMKNIALIAEAEYKREKSSRESDIKDKDTTIKSQKDRITSLEDQLVKAQDAELKAKEDLQKAEGKFSTETTTQQQLTKEIGFLKSERDELTKDKQNLQKEILALQTEVNNQKKLAVDNKLEADSQRARAERMLRRNEELEKENLALGTQVKILSATGGSASTSLLNPPPVPAPKDVHGTITAVANSGLAAISIGSDSGLSVGNKLEVYRVDPADPVKSLYLGELVLSRVEPKQAVGQFVPKPFAKPDERLPKVKDTVSTGIGSPGR